MAAPSVHEGTLIKGYRIGRCLGTGSMGEVYEATNESNGKRVALKVLREGTEEALNASRRLLEEARAVNAIRHPGIVEVFDLGLMGEGRPFLVMELLEGLSLSARLKQGLFPVPDAIAVLEGMFDALGAAHRAGVVHRDLKPSNVFLVGKGNRVKLLDFGVARREGRKELLTRPSMSVGSLGYMAPEQMLGTAVASSDLYAVGCVAFLLFTHKPVFPLKNIVDNSRMHLRDAPPKLRSLRPEVSPQLESFVELLLKKKPEERPATATIALAKLRAITGRTGQTLEPEAERRTEVVPAFVPTSEPRTTAVEAFVPGPDSTMLDE
jgi:serine/threonine-protein kinase